eukprot:14350448-Alexandrium_andersonii.AAC.1
MRCSRLPRGSSRGSGTKSRRLRAAPCENVLGPVAGCCMRWPADSWTSWHDDSRSSETGTMKKRAGSQAMRSL